MHAITITAGASASRHKRNPVIGKAQRTARSPADRVERLLRRRLSHYAADASFPTFLETLYYDS